MAKLDTIQVGGTDYEMCGAAATTLALSTSGWVDDEYDITNNSFFKASGYSYIITPRNDDREAWNDSNISVDDISTDDQCTFHCETTPSSAITVNVTRVVV